MCNTPGQLAQTRDTEQFLILILRQTMKTINLSRGNIIQPIEWKQYEGETVIVKTIIRKGERIRETEFFPDKVKAVPRGNAYCIGNGPSRKGFDLNRLKETGQTYGCNALYRDFMPDFIFSVDTKMTMKMCEDEVGLRTDLTIILFTLDETSYSRVLAPMAGVYPALKLGPPWWFFDSYEGMKRFRESTTETCGFYNTVGFNDDTRAFCSIPARHDVARRVDCAYLAELVSSGRLRENEAFEVAYDLAYGLAKSAYKL